MPFSRRDIIKLSLLTMSYVIIEVPAVNSKTKNKRSTSQMELVNFMDEAIKEAEAGIKNNEGGPFGAVIVKGGKIVARGHNMVLLTNDPTAHAEIVAIRKASEKLKNFDLKGCQLYATCEPCPMCLSAIFWSRIDTIYFGCSKEDAAKIGFDDKLFYEMLQDPELMKKYLKEEQLKREDCMKIFNDWQQKADKKMY
jgi:tRNA(Arg) A34 adenosine deaminase TadA